MKVLGERMLSCNGVLYCAKDSGSMWGGRIFVVELS